MNVASARVSLSHCPFKERIQINLATKPNQIHSNDFRGDTFKVLSTTQKRVKWNMNSNICQLWTKETAIKFHREKSDPPGGLQHLFTSDAGMHLSSDTPPIGQGAEGSPLPTMRVCVALFILIYYILYLRER